jgi:hypothetical protein
MPGFARKPVETTDAAPIGTLYAFRSRPQGRCAMPFPHLVTPSTLERP